MSQEEAGPDDIFRAIDEENLDQRKAEVDRLIKKLRSLKGHHTSAYYVLSNLITATRGDDNNFDTSTGNQNAIEHAREKLEQRFDKLERCYNRLLSISHGLNYTDGRDIPTKLEGDFKQIQDNYGEIIAARGKLMIDMLPKPASQQGHAGAANQNLKPIDALKPSFTLDIENSPTDWQPGWHSSRPIMRHPDYMSCQLSSNKPFCDKVFTQMFGLLFSKKST